MSTSGIARRNGAAVLLFAYGGRAYGRPYHVARKAGFEAKGAEEGCDSIGSCRDLVARGRHNRATVDPAGNTPENTAPVITLGEEEISDVSLTTFFVFDNESAEAHRPRLQQLAQRRA